MKKTLLYGLTTALALAASPAFAVVTISATANVDGTLLGPLTSSNGTLNLVNQSLGVFDLNTITVNAGPAFVAPPGVLRTNTLNVDLNAGGTHSLVLDIISSGLTGTAGLTNFLSTFSVSSWPARWTAWKPSTMASAGEQLVFHH